MHGHIAHCFAWLTLHRVISVVLDSTDGPAGQGDTVRVHSNDGDVFERSHLTPDDFEAIKGLAMGAYCAALEQSKR